MYARKKALNPQVCLEFFCFITFAALLLYLVISGKYLSYVTPRMKPYLCFTAAVMLLWSGAALFRLYRPQHKTRAAHCLVLVIPMILLLFPHAPVGAADLSSGYLGGNALSGRTGISPSGSSDNTADAAPSPGEDIQLADDGADLSAGGVSDPSGNVPPDAQAGGESEIPPGLDAENKKIAVQDAYFAAWMAEIFINMKKYEGYQITVKGFVFRDPSSMQENQFVPARLMMSCCVADLVPCGFLCQYDKASELQQDSWVTVEGVIRVEEFMGQDEPQIIAAKISPAEKPEEEYVYP